MHIPSPWRSGLSSVLLPSSLLSLEQPPTAGTESISYPTEAQSFDDFFAELNNYTVITHK